MDGVGSMVARGLSMTHHHRRALGWVGDNEEIHVSPAMTRTRPLPMDACNTRGNRFGTPMGVGDR